MRQLIVRITKRRNLCSFLLRDREVYFLKFFLPHYYPDRDSFCGLVVICLFDYCLSSNYYHSSHYVWWWWSSTSGLVSGCSSTIREKEVLLSILSIRFATLEAPQSEKGTEISHSCLVLDVNCEHISCPVWSVLQQQCKV